MVRSDTLAALPLSTLFSAPLIAATDASAQTQRETVNLLREVGFEPDGTPTTVSFEYATTEIDSASGEQQRRQKTLTVPVLLFLSLPELVVHEIEQSFSAKIVDVESTRPEQREDEEDSPRRSPSLVPRRLKVAPAAQSETFARRTQTTFELDITMRAEVENRSTGVDLLERALSTTVTDLDTDQGAENRRPATREREEREREREEVMEE